MLAPRETPAAAIDLAHLMRMLMAEDLDEYDMADNARTMNRSLNNSPHFNDAWNVLTTAERRAWKSLLTTWRPEDEHRY